MFGYCQPQQKLCGPRNAHFQHLMSLVGKPGRNTEVWAVPKHFLGYLAEFILNSHCRSRKHDPTKDVSTSGTTRHSEINGFKDIRTLNKTVDYLVEDDDIRTLFLLRFLKVLGSRCESLASNFVQRIWMDESVSMELNSVGQEGY